MNTHKIENSEKTARKCANCASLCVSAIFDFLY